METLKKLTDRYPVFKSIVHSFQRDVNRGSLDSFLKIDFMRITHILLGWYLADIINNNEHYEAVSALEKIYNKEETI